MLKGLRKVLGKPGKKQAAQKGGAADASHRSASSAAQSELFPCDLGSELDIAGWQHDPSQHSQSSSQQQPEQQPAQHQQPPRLSAAVIQQHLQLQAELQKLDADADSSTSKRQAAALQKRINNAMLNPSTCLYQISSLLSLSTLFEHKLQRDTLQALQQMPGSLFQAAAAAAQSSRCEQHSSSGGGACEAGSDGACDGSCCCGPSGRTPSATAASTAHVALQLSRWGYRVIVRKVLHSKAYWTKSMDNTFIVALDTSSGGHVEYVVDPHFRETFNVGVMSSNYSAVWHSLPHVFVGMPCQLQPVVQLLCEEMELSFLEAGRPCPPWRSWAATINRWMSDQYVDILVPDAAAPEAEVAEYVSRCCQISSQACGPCGGASSASTATTATTASTTCSPMYGLQQQRLTDKMHVSSVLSSASTSSRRPVQEPQHKQLGFDAGTIMETDLDDPPSQLRDASFTSVASSGSAESAALVAAAVAAAATAAAAAKPAPGPHSLSVPSADCCSSSLSSSIGLSAPDAVCGDLAAAAAAAAATQHQRQQQAAAQLAAATAAASTRAAAAAAGQPTRDDQQHQQSRGRASSSSSSRASGSGSGTKSLLTAQMQLKAQLLQQQQQQQRLLFPFGNTGYSVLHPQQQQLHQQQAALLQQQQPQAAQQLVQLQLQLQQQSSQLQLQQQLALQQQQQQLLLAQHQIVAQQQQQSVAQLLPVVHTVRPCGVPAVAQQQPPMQQQPYVQQLHLHQQQQQPRAPLFGLPALQQLHQATAAAQEQPRLLRLIQRTKQ